MGTSPKYYVRIDTIFDPSKPPPTPPHLDQESCENCRFSKSSDVRTWCHRFPPTMHLDADCDEHTLFVSVENTDWCGEWKAVSQTSCATSIT